MNVVIAVANEVGLDQPVPDEVAARVASQQHPASLVADLHLRQHDDAGEIHERPVSERRCFGR